MKKLPVIVGLGGINAAGRSSGFHSYKRLVAESLSAAQMASTWRDLGVRMGLLGPDEDLTEACLQAIVAGTLVRRIDRYDPSQVVVQQKMQCQGDDGKTRFRLKKSKLPAVLPEHWQVEPADGDHVDITATGDVSCLVETTTTMAVTSAGCLPKGFEPSALYSSRHHPRGLQLTVFGANDLLSSVGLSWSQICQHISPDQVSVYAGSALGQGDQYALAGLFAAPFKGERTSSKMMSLGMAEMPADFINSYILNSVGSTGTNMGACASFLYNLRQGIADIQSGVAKVVIVGSAEAPVEPAIMEGFRAMGALAEDHQLASLDQVEQADHRRACRPFSDNVGFTIAESAQFFMLMDDELALQLGANILGAVPEVFINADANKKSISAPGIGNYITMAKATALAQGLLGTAGLQQTYVQAHGTGTPQNRVTESHILNEIAKTFQIQRWPVTSVKAYVGHSIGSAGGDQLCAALGVWQYGWIPGIKTIRHLAEDVSQSHLDFLLADKFVGAAGEDIKAVLINAKGFGGNNASCVVLSPAQTMTMLRRKHGQQAIDQYWLLNQAVQQVTQQADLCAQQGQQPLTYHFGTAVMGPADVSLTADSVRLSAFHQSIPLPTGEAFSDYL
jgi:acetoacetyl-[acyl-carrier protein] synthase